MKTGHFVCMEHFNHLGDQWLGYGHFFYETFRISYCELAKHVGQFIIHFGTIWKITFLLLPPLLPSPLISRWMPVVFVLVPPVATVIPAIPAATVFADAMISCCWSAPNHRHHHSPAWSGGAKQTRVIARAAQAWMAETVFCQRRCSAMAGENILIPACLCRRGFWGGVGGAVVAGCGGEEGGKPRNCWVGSGATPACWCLGREGGGRCDAVLVGR